MSKATTDPFLLGLDGPSAPQEKVRATAKTKTSGDPYLLGMGDKKKVAGGESFGQPSAAPSPIPSTSQSQSTSESVDQAMQNFNQKKATPDDIKTLSQTDFGKANGLNNLDEKGYDQYARAHNNGTQVDLKNSVQDVTSKYGDLLYSVPQNTNVSAFDAQIAKANSAKKNGLIQKVRTGDVDASVDFKKQVLNNLNGQLAALQQQAREQGDSRGTLPVVRPDQFRTLQDNQNRQADDIKAKIADVSKTMDSWVDNNLVKQAKDKPGGIYSNENLIWIGQQRRKINAAAPNQFEHEEHIHDPEAITERNYLDHKEGLQSAIQNTSKDYAGLYKEYVRTGDPTTKIALNDYGLRLNGLLEQSSKLDEQYLPVQMYKVGRILQDKIAANHNAFNVHISEDDIDEAVDQLDKESPGFKKNNEAVIGAIKRKEETSGWGTLLNPLGPTSALAPKFLSRQGLVGGIESGAQSGLKEVAHGIESLLGRRTEADRAADEIKEQFEPKTVGTEQEGLTRTKLVTGENGEYFREVKNENYNKFFNWNSVLHGVGQFTGNMAVYGALTEGLGDVAGLAAKGPAKIINAVGKEVNAQVAATLGQDAEEFQKMAEPFAMSVRTKNTVGLVASTYLMNYDSNLAQIEKEIPDQSNNADFKRGFAANMLTLAQAAAMKVLPPNAFIRDSFMRDVKTDALKILSEDGILQRGMTKDFLKNWLNRTKEAALSYVKTGAKTNAEMLIINHSNAMINSMFDETGATKKNNVYEQDLNTIKDVTLGTLFLNLPKLVPESMKTLQRDALYDAALHKDENIERIRGLMESGDMDEARGNGIIKLLNTAEKHMPTAFFGRNDDGTPFSANQTKRSLFNLVSKDALESYLKDHPDDEEAKKALAGVNKSLKDLSTETPYERINDSETLKAIGVKDASEIDPKQEYTFELIEKPIGFSKPEVTEKKDEDGNVTGYEVKATGAKILEHLPNSEINEKDNQAADAEAKKAEGTTPSEAEGAKTVQQESQVNPSYEKNDEREHRGSEERGVQETPQTGERNREQDEEHQGGVQDDTDNGPVGSNQSDQNEKPMPEQSGSVSFEDDAREMRDNHAEALRMIERKDDRISSYDLANPDKVKESVLKNIAAKEKAHEQLTDAERQIAEKRRGDIDEIKINDQEEKLPKKTTQEETKRAEDLRNRIKLIDKFGIDDVVKRAIDNGIVKRDCS